LIRLNEVKRTYGAGLAACDALRGITMEIRAGAFTALAGPSGSGKTSLLNIIGGLDTPSAGMVLVEGRNLSAMSDAELSEFRLRLVGFVFQNFSLVPVLSVAENVEFPLLFRREMGASERRGRVAKILERFGLEGKERRRPDELSGGERQRVALARALAGEPPIILADEPTANLDQDAGTNVIELMRSLNRERGTTFLYATHDPQLLSLADSVLKLRNGRLEDETA
jgi:putative ABC transport system ATP-binding protein